MREKGEGYREEEEHENVLTLSKAELERIFVSIRVRPLNEKERARCDVPEWECISSNTIRFSGIPEPRAPSNDSYTFDRVFGERCSTQIVYEQGIKEVALSVVSGINSSIFAYGQTSSGKTYTMTGITNYAIRDIYDYIEKHKEREFAVKFSAMEIYNEAVRDLLSAQVTPLRVLDDPEKGTVVEKLTEETLKDKNQLQQLLYTCAAERTTEETAMNETSSRSHQILRLTVESNPNDYVRTARSGTLIASVNFVDLAGSERASQAMSAGTRLREGSHINRSLLTLGTVIRKLSKERNGHIPYRDSKLTRILHNSLGGNARTAIICTISPARSQVEQSRNTLFFAGCAKQVATNAKVNVMISDKVLVKQLQKELARMENELRNFNPHSTILKERELQIEQMDKQIKELTRQRDLFQSHIENLLHSAAEDRLMKVDKDSASELSSVGAASYLGLGTDNTSENLYRTTSSVSISNDQLLQEHENSEEDFLLDGSPPMFVGPDPCQGWEEIASRAESEDNFKEVPCNEKKEAETDVDASIPVFEEEEEEGGGGGGNTPMKQVVSVDAINKSSSRNGYDELSHVALDNSQDTQQQRNQDLHADLSEKSFGSSESESHILTVMSPPQTDKVDQETASHPQFIKLDNSQVARQQKYQDFRLECSEKSNKSFESESDILAVMSPPQTDKVDQETATHPQFIKLDNSQDAQQQKYQDFRLERSEKSNASCESESHILAAMSPPQTDEVDQETATHPQFIKLDNSQDAQQEKYQDFCLERSEKSNASCESESHILAAMSPQTDKVDQETASQPQFTKLDNNKDTLQQKYQDFRLERSEKPDKSFESESHILAAMSPPQTDKVDQEIVSHPQFTKLDNSQDALQQNNQDFRLERSEKSNASFESEPRNPPSRSSRGRSSWPILAAMFPPQTYKVDQKTSSRPHFTKLDHKVVSPSQFNKLDQEPATPHFDEQELKTMSPPQSYESSPHFHEQEVKTMLPPQSDQAPQHFDEQEVETVVPSQSDDSLPHFHEQDPKTMLASQSEESPPHFDEQEQKTMLSPQSDQASPYFDEPEFRTMLTPQSDQAPPRFDEPEFKTKLPPQSHEAPPHFDEQELKARSPPQSDQALPYFDEQGLKTMLAPQSGKFEQASVKEHSTSLVGFHEELSEPKLHAKKRKSPRKYSLVKEMDDTSAEEESVMDSDSEETASVLNFVITMNERAKPTPLKNDFEDLMVRAKTRESHKRLNRVKGISFQAAPSKFERRQRDIIELWNRCNVPLVHRSYFFLLIKGELSDSVYLDVEFRRLSFLKDTFSRGTSITGEVGVDVTPNSSSMKALNRERKMLSKQVHKKFSKKEREELYQKWCIDLKTKHRSIQLAWLLWTNIKDMNHVRESATLVAKLVGFIDSGEAPKKVFGLSFLSRLKSKKSNDWKDTMSVV